MPRVGSGGGFLGLHLLLVILRILISPSFADILRIRDHSFVVSCYHMSLCIANGFSESPVSTWMGEHG